MRALILMMMIAPNPNLVLVKSRPTAIIAMPGDEKPSDVWTLLSCFQRWGANKDVCEGLLRRLHGELKPGTKAKLCLHVGQRRDCVPVDIDLGGG